MAIRPDNSFAQFLPTPQKTEEIQIKMPAIVEGGIPDLRGIQSMNEVLANVGKETEALGKVLKIQERERQLCAAGSEFNLRRSRAEVQADSLPYKDAPDFIVNQLEKDRDELAGRITDTEAKQKFSEYAAENASQSIGKIMWNSRKKEIDDNLATLFESIDKDHEALNQDPTKYEQTEQTVIGRIQMAVKNGLLAADKGEILIEGEKEKIDETRIAGLKNQVYEKTIDPDEAIRQIQDTKNFTRVDPKIRQDAILEIMAAADHVKKESIAQKEHDENQEHQRSAWAREAKRDEFTSRIFDFQLKKSTESIETIENDILKAARNREIDGPQEHSLLALIKGSKTGPSEDDPIEYARVFDQVMRGVGDPSHIAFDSNLKVETKINLINKVYEINKSDIGEEQKNNLNIIKSMIITTGPLEKLDSSQQRRYAEAEKEFDRLIDQAKSKGSINFDEITNAIIWKWGNPDQIVKTLPKWVKINGTPYLATFDPEALKKIAMEANKITDEKEKNSIASWLRQLNYLSQKRIEMFETPATEINPKGEKRK